MKKQLIRHDAFFKKSFEIPEVAQEFLEQHLPQTLLQKLDTKTAKKIDGNFVDKHLAHKLSDVVLQVKQREAKENSFIYLLLEHQSKPDPKMPLRMHRYLGLLAEKLWDPKRKKIPVIYPLLFYNGKHPYSESLQLSQLFAEPELMQELLDRVPLVDLTQISDQELKNRLWAGAIQLSMKHIYQADTTPLIEELVARFKNLINIEKRTLLMSLIIWYNMIKIPEEKISGLNELIKENISEGEDIMGSAAEKFFNDGLQQGMQQGMQRGMQQGMQQGIYQVARNMLAKGINIRTTAETTGLSLIEVQKLKQSLR